MKSILVALSFVLSSQAFAQGLNEEGMPQANDFKWRYEGSLMDGYEMLRSHKEVAPEYDHLFVRPAVTFYLGEDESWKLVADFRFRLELREDENNRESEISARALYVQKNLDKIQISVGIQEVSWGEAFGFKIADVVNPYEVTDYLLANPADAKIPVLLIDTLFLLGPMKLNLLVSPTPAHTKLETMTTPIRIEKAPAHYDQPEFGARLGYLTASGLDIKLSYYTHGNRLPILQPTTTINGPAMEMVDDRMQTYGLNFSQAWDSVVLRGDFTHEPDQPFNEAGTSPEYEDLARTQGVVGADYTSESGKMIFAAQIQGDSWSEVPAGQEESQLYWGAVRAHVKLFNDVLEAQATAWHGIGNSDVWLQAGLTYNAPYSIVVNVGADWVESKDDGSAIYFNTQKNFYASITHKTQF